MRASRPSKRGNMRWNKHALDLCKAAAMLGDFMHGLVEGEPVSADVWLDHKGRHRRLFAAWSNGWHLELHFSLKGEVSSSSWSCSLKVSGEKEAA